MPYNQWLKGITDSKANATHEPCQAPVLRCIFPQQNGDKLKDYLGFLSILQMSLEESQRTIEKIKEATPEKSQYKTWGDPRENIINVTKKPDS